MAKRKPKTKHSSVKRRSPNRRASAKGTVGTTRAATKQAACVALLERAQGATVAELQRATGWKPHSVRGFLAGTVKKKLGLNIASTKEERGRVYRVARTKNGNGAKIT